MRKHTLTIANLANRQDIQLTEFITTSDVDWEKNRPSDQHSDKKSVAQDFEISQKEEPIERAMVENESIWSLEERFHPVEPARGEWRNVFAMDSEQKLRNNDWLYILRRS